MVISFLACFSILKVIFKALRAGLLFVEKVTKTATRLAEGLTKRTEKNYTIGSLSKKLVRNFLRADEYKLIAQILGYEVKLIKKYPSTIKPKNKK